MVRSKPCSYTPPGAENATSGNRPAISPLTRPAVVRGVTCRSTVQEASLSFRL